MATIAQGSAIAGDMDRQRFGLSFPNTQHGTVYLDIQKGIDIRTDPQFQTNIKSFYGADLETKGPVTTTSNLMAVGTSYSATSGSIPANLPTWVDRKLYDLTLKKTPLASGLIPRVANNGLFADYITRTSVQTAVWNPEGAALTSVSGTYSRVAAPMKYLYAVGEVSGPLMVASKVWQDALAMEIEAAYKAVKYLEENTIINGDVATGTTYLNGFNGFETSITTNNTTMSGTTEITLAHLDTALSTIRTPVGNYGPGEPNLIVTDWRTYYRIKQLMRDYILYGATNSLNFGFENMLYEGIPIIPDVFMPSTATARSLYVLDTQTQNNIQIRVLQDATFEDLAKTADSYKFMIKEYLTMIIVRQAWCYRYYNLP